MSLCVSACVCINISMLYYYCSTGGHFSSFCVVSCVDVSHNIVYILCVCASMRNYVLPTKDCESTFDSVLVVKLIPLD